MTYKPGLPLSPEERLKFELIVADYSSFAAQEYDYDELELYEGAPGFRYKTVLAALGRVALIPLQDTMERLRKRAGPQRSHEKRS